jgi:hypothetical protein
MVSRISSPMSSLIPAREPSDARAGFFAMNYLDRDG